MNMNQQLMKGFELLGSQFGSKLGLMGDSSSSHSEEKKTMGEQIFSEQDPIIDPMNFRAHQGLIHLNFLFPKNRLTFNLKLI